MDTHYILDWVNLLLRWAHIIVGIAWIGSSFYFVWLDNHLQAPDGDDLKAKGVSGELWAVHGGGFYNPQKYMVAPKNLPHNLHWFYWESYSTFLTGFALFSVLYLYNATTFLIDQSKMDWSPGAAVGVALAFLVSGWVVYDMICRFLGHVKAADGKVRIGGDLRVGVCIFVYVVFASWLACHWFSGRAAFLLVGAMLATIMTANVFFWIIPGQQTVIAQMRAGQPVDAIHGQRGKQRSVHNTYFTLPVLFAMMSNHYSFTYNHPHNWAVLVLIMLASVLIRQFFLSRHKGNTLWRFPLAGVGILIAVAVWIAPAKAPTPAAAGAAPTASTSTDANAASFAQVQAIVLLRCAMCHNAQLAQKGVQLHTPEAVLKNATAIYQQAVLSKAMPMNNATQITEAERAVLGAWVLAGAKP
jgi:uncharacterized membrane protein